MNSLRKTVFKARLASRATRAALSTAKHYGLLNLDQARHPKSKHDDVLYAWVNRWGRSLLNVFGLRVKAEGLHLATGDVYPRWSGQGVGRIFLANHRSAFDIPLILGLTESRLVSRHDLAEWPFIGASAKRAGTLFVDRESRRSGATVLNEMCTALEQGHAIAIYPEGTAHSGDEVHAFHMGAFKAAERTGAELIPIGIAYGDARAYYGDETFGQHLARAGSLRNIDVGICVGHGFYAESGDLERVNELARTEVQRLVHAARALVGPVRSA